MWNSGKINVAGVAASGGKFATDQRGGPHSGEGLDSVDQPLIKIAKLRLRIAGKVSIETDRDEMIAVETGIEVREVAQSACKQASTHEKNERESYLERDQSLLERPTRPRVAGKRASTFESMNRLNPRALQRGGEAKHNSGEHCDPSAEAQDARIGRKIQRNRVASTRSPSRQDLAEPISNHASKQSSANRQENAFHKQLAHQPTPACAN